MAKKKRSLLDKAKEAATNSTPPPPVDPRPDWQKVADDLDEMFACDDERYEFAGDMLRSIRKYIDRWHRVTPKQIAAVYNVRDGGDRMTEYRSDLDQDYDPDPDDNWRSDT